MRYQGGKERISKQVAEVLRGGQNESDTFVSLFCGTCSIESKLNCYSRIICNDIHPYLIAMLKGVRDGYVFPDMVTEEEWKYRREYKDENPVMTGFVGFGCSFGGRFFQGYARDKENRNYALATKNSLERLSPKIQNIEFLCLDYRDVKLPDGCVVYCDPPYSGTKEYAGIKFDSDSFWKYMRKISKDHLVFISELNAPDDFVPIWEKKVTRTLDINKSNMFKSTEKIFVHQNNAKKCLQ